MQRGERTWLLLCLTLCFSARALAQCYHFDGSLVTSTNYVPCNSQVGVASMCCAKNMSSGADECLPNGLCRNYVQNSQGTGILTLFWRESCSDRNWKSPFCLNLCTAGSGQVIGEFRNYSQDDVLVNQCPDGSYCCGQTNTTCCDMGQGTTIANIIGQKVTTSSITSRTSSASTLSSSSVSTTSPTPSASTTPAPSPSPSPSSGAKIGIGVGVGVGVTLALLAGGAWYLARKNARARRVQAANSYIPVNTQGSPKAEQIPSQRSGSRLAHELGDTHVAYEMESPGMQKGISELQGSRR